MLASKGALKEQLLPLDESTPAPKGWEKYAKALIAGVGVCAVGAICTVIAMRSDSSPSALPVASSGTRLRIINGCKKDPLFIANFAVDKPAFPQDLKLEAGATHDFDIPEEGLPSTRFWAKWGCDAKGMNCLIGESGGPGESCGPTGCAPPIDSKFEATFGCMPNSKTPCAHNPSDPTQPIGPIDWWDVSQVDGWTLPYKVDIVGNCPQSPQQIDCSRLSLDSCPKSEDLGLPSGAETLKLLSPDGSPAGCYSPCAKLTYSQWDQGHTFTPESPQARHYCCPTPPITPDQCSTGPVIQTK